MCASQILCRAPPRGPNPDLSPPTGSRGARQRWGRRARGGGGGGAVQPALPSPFPSPCLRATAPGPLRIPGTGGTGWGMGLCRKMPPPLPLLSVAPSPRFPSASAWEIWALQSHTRAKEILLELILLNLNFKVRVVGRRRTVGNTFL